jgi:hypothetical protein
VNGDKFGKYSDMYPGYLARDGSMYLNIMIQNSVQYVRSLIHG